MCNLLKAQTPNAREQGMGIHVVTAEYRSHCEWYGNNNGADSTKSWESSFLLDTWMIESSMNTNEVSNVQYNSEHTVFLLKEVHSRTMMLLKELAYKKEASSGIVASNLYMLQGYVTTDYPTYRTCLQPLINGRHEKLENKAVLEKS
jgi:hypothetical protein